MRTPALYDLMGGYFHQDWWKYGTENVVVDQFMVDQLTLRDRLVPEIQKVLAGNLEEEDLAALVEELGAEHNPVRRYGPTRGWLEGVMQRAMLHERREL